MSDSSAQDKEAIQEKLETEAKSILQTLGSPFKTYKDELAGLSAAVIVISFVGYFVITYAIPHSELALKLLLLVPPLALLGYCVYAISTKWRRFTAAKHVVIFIASALVSILQAFNYFDQLKPGQNVAFVVIWILLAVLFIALTVKTCFDIDKKAEWMDNRLGYLFVTLILRTKVNDWEVATKVAQALSELEIKLYDSKVWKTFMDEMQKQADAANNEADDARKRLLDKHGKLDPF